MSANPFEGVEATYEEFQGITGTNRRLSISLSGNARTVVVSVHGPSPVSLKQRKGTLCVNGVMCNTKSEALNPGIYIIKWLCLKATEESANFELYYTLKKPSKHEQILPRIAQSSEPIYLVHDERHRAEYCSLALVTVLLDQPISDSTKTNEGVTNPNQSKNASSTTEPRSNSSAVEAKDNRFADPVLPICPSQIPKLIREFRSKPHGSRILFTGPGILQASQVFGAHDSTPDFLRHGTSPLAVALLQSMYQTNSHILDLSSATLMKMPVMTSTDHIKNSREDSANCNEAPSNTGLCSLPHTITLTSPTIKRSDGLIPPLSSLLTPLSVQILSSRSEPDQSSDPSIPSTRTSDYMWHVQSSTSLQKAEQSLSDAGILGALIARCSNPNETKKNGTESGNHRTESESKSDAKALQEANEVVAEWVGLSVGKWQSVVSAVDVALGISKTHPDSSQNETKASSNIRVENSDERKKDSSLVVYAPLLSILSLDPHLAKAQLFSLVKALDIGLVVYCLDEMSPNHSEDLLFTSLRETLGYLKKKQEGDLNIAVRPLATARGLTATLASAYTKLPFDRIADINSGCQGTSFLATQKFVTSELWLGFFFPGYQNFRLKHSTSIALPTLTNPKVGEVSAVWCNSQIIAYMMCISGSNWIVRLTSKAQGHCAREVIKLVSHTAQAVGMESPSQGNDGDMERFGRDQSCTIERSVSMIDSKSLEGYLSSSDLLMGACESEAQKIADNLHTEPHDENIISLEPEFRKELEEKLERVKDALAGLDTTTANWMHDRETLLWDSRWNQATLTGVIICLVAALVFLCLPFERAVVVFVATAFFVTTLFQIVAPNPLESINLSSEDLTSSSLPDVPPPEEIHTVSAASLLATDPEVEGERIHSLSKEINSMQGFVHKLLNVGLQPSELPQVPAISKLENPQTPELGNALRSWLGRIIKRSYKSSQVILVVFAVIVCIVGMWGRIHHYTDPDMMYLPQLYMPYSSSAVDSFVDPCGDACGSLAGVYILPYISQHHRFEVALQLERNAKPDDVASVLNELRNTDPDAEQCKDDCGTFSAMLYFPYTRPRYFRIDMMLKPSLGPEDIEAVLSKIKRKGVESYRFETDPIDLVDSRVIPPPPSKDVRSGTLVGVLQFPNAPASQVNIQLKPDATPQSVLHILEALKNRDDAAAARSRGSCGILRATLRFPNSQGHRIRIEITLPPQATPESAHNVLASLRHVEVDDASGNAVPNNRSVVPADPAIRDRQNVHNYLNAHDKSI